MLKLKYLDSNKTYDVSFFVVTDNIVEIIGDFPIQTTGLAILQLFTVKLRMVFNFLMTVQYMLHLIQSLNCLT